jgi:type IV secretory pathway VirB4 component
VRLLDTSSLATVFPFSSGSLQMEGGVLLGLNTENNSLVLLNAFSPDLPNANACVMAKAGAGKSYTSKAELLHAMPFGVRALVIDPENEYVRLAEAMSGQVVRLAAGARTCLNPLDLPPATTTVARTGTTGPDDEGDGSVENPLREHLAGVHGFLDIALAGEGRSLDQHAKGVLDRALFACYAEKGITDDPATHRRPAPILADLQATLRAMGETLGLADRLERYCTGTLAGLFSGPTMVRCDGRLCVFALRDLDDDLRPAAMYLVAHHVWGLVTRDPRTPRRLVVDEAHVLTRHHSGDGFLENLARRGRKYFLGLTAISQDVRDFLDTKAGKAILTNSAMRLLLRQDESTLEALEQGLHLTPAERSYLVTCPRGEGLLCVGSLRIKLRILASPQEHVLITTDPRELARSPMGRPDAQHRA